MQTVKGLNNPSQHEKNHFIVIFSAQGNKIVCSNLFYNEIWPSGWIWTFEPTKALYNRLV